ncbi:MAG TPA: LysR family transcriptional regulator [Candidatus Aphodousia faecavium]|nr:LysR family transcriptional regulator [Candidatus Aphodousia faecavium]
MSKLDDLMAWRYLIAFSKTGTLQAAADMLNVDVSNVSRSIAALEKALGCDLIRHNARPMQLSDTGKMVVRRMGQILRAHDSLMQKVIDDNSALTGNIRLSSAPGFAARRLTPLLQRFQELHPGITVEILSGFKPTDVQKGLCDIATITGEPTLPGLCYMSRGRNVYLPVASPAYIQKHGMPIDPVNLRQHTGLIYNGPVREETKLLYRGDKAAPIVFASSIRSTDILAIRNALLEGMGVAVDMPLVQIYEDLLAGRLVAILPGWFHPPVECFIVASHEAWHMKRVRIFLKWYAKEMQALFASYESQISDMVGLPKDIQTYDRNKLYRT